MMGLCQQREPVLTVNICILELYIPRQYVCIGFLGFMFENITSVFSAKVSVNA